MEPDTKTLSTVAPREFLVEYRDTRAYALRDKTVTAEHDARVTRWPGREVNVMVWWELSSGHAVGWNENPARGWSFPVIKLKNNSPKEVNTPS